MSRPKHVQTAAIRFYNSHPCLSYLLFFLIIAPLLTFLLSRSDFSTSSPARINRINRLAKRLDLPSPIFGIPSKQPEQPDLLTSNSPPSGTTPPFLKIVMPRHSSPTPYHHPFRPDSSTGALKTLTGSTISSSEREVFAKIFDQMITQPISEERHKHRFMREKKTEPATGGKRRSLGMSASLLDESLFLTPKEVEEYPAALRPLAARFAREERKGGESGGEEELIVRRIDVCKTDYEVSLFLDRDVFSVMEAHAQGRRLPANGTFSFDTIRANYSLILLKAMRLYRITYQNPLAAHTLFLRAKTLSAESYVLGCTAPLYNELLISRWESFTDLFSICEILDEMSANGVKGDVETIEIIKKIQEEVEEWATQGPEVARALWVGERDRMGKLERAKKEIAARLEEDNIEEEVLDEDPAELEEDLRSLNLSPIH